MSSVVQLISERCCPFSNVLTKSVHLHSRNQKPCLFIVTAFKRSCMRGTDLVGSRSIAHYLLKNNFSCRFYCGSWYRLTIHGMSVLSLVITKLQHYSQLVSAIICTSFNFQIQIFLSVRLIFVALLNFAVVFRAFKFYRR